MEQQQQSQPQDCSNEEWGDPLCTFAATGTHPAFQPIYICHTCSKKQFKGNGNGNGHDNDDDDDDGGGAQNDLVEEKEEEGKGEDEEEEEEEEEMSPAALLCICQNCAEACHEALGHDVQYVGTGQSYCDCHTLGQQTQQQLEDDNEECCSLSCVLYSRSCQVAQRLGIHVKENLDGNGYGNVEQKKSESGMTFGMGVNYNLPEKERSEEKDNEDDSMAVVSSSSFRFTFESLSIPALMTTAIAKAEDTIPHSIDPISHPCDTLIDQAKEFVKHSKDTHWIPHDTSTTTLERMCNLEQLAFKIFQRHVMKYNLMEQLQAGQGGAEWWVQVKNIAAPGGNVNGDGAGRDSNNSSNNNNNNEAIDLHYDKDEELAEAFELGSFPTLSTVTYLTGNTIVNMQEEMCSAPPTVIFPHTYEMNDEGPIGGFDVDESSGEVKLKLSSSPQMIMSHSRRGKHIVFDGKLLHGSPSNLLLRHDVHDQETCTHVQESSSGAAHRGLRVTFLVNIWLTRRPSKVTILPESIREQIQNCSDNIMEKFMPMTSPEVPLKMEQRECEIIHIHHIESGPRERIHLPFVSSGATWVDDMGNEEEESGLVVSIFAPHSCKTDTSFVSYGEEMAPLLEYIGGEDDEDSDVSDAAE